MLIDSGRDETKDAPLVVQIPHEHHFALRSTKPTANVTNVKKRSATIGHIGDASHLHRVSDHASTVGVPCTDRARINPLNPRRCCNGRFKRSAGSSGSSGLAAVELTNDKDLAISLKPATNPTATGPLT